MGVDELRATPTGFEVSGTGWYGCLCSTCGTKVEGIKESFAAQCVGIRCPNCDGQDVVGKITAIKRDGSEYRFSGFIECGSCGHEGLWKRVLRSIAKLKRVKLAVGPTSGVEVEVERA